MDGEFVEGYYNTVTITLKPESAAQVLSQEKEFFTFGLTTLDSLTNRIAQPKCKFIIRRRHACQFAIVFHPMPDWSSTSIAEFLSRNEHVKRVTLPAY